MSTLFAKSSRYFHLLQPHLPWVRRWEGIYRFWIAAVPRIFKRLSPGGPMVYGL